MTDSTAGTLAITHERIRQIEKEGFDAEHDSDHNPAELIFAAEAYQQYARCQLNMQIAGRTFSSSEVPDYWPWEPEWFKPSDDIRRNLEKAGALIVAAYDRIQYAVDHNE